MDPWDVIKMIMMSNFNLWEAAVKSYSVCINVVLQLNIYLIDKSNVFIFLTDGRWHGKLYQV
jgi:hypothetical protein